MYDVGWQGDVGWDDGGVDKQGGGDVEGDLNGRGCESAVLTVPVLYEKMVGPYAREVDTGRLRSSVVEMRGRGAFSSVVWGQWQAYAHARLGEGPVDSVGHHAMIRAELIGCGRGRRRR